MQQPDMLPISKIKIRIPFRRRELIRRNQLLESIYDQMESRLLLVVAPAGYGKTSLLVDLAQDSELPVSWLSLDVLDQEPQRFLTYLIYAIAETYPDFGRDSIAALESMSSFEQDGERVLVTLTNEIAKEINEDFILVLDDYHLVGDVLIIRQIISRFLQLASENVHLILASRNLPDFPDMPLLTIRSQVGGLSFEELAFRPDEIQALFLQNEGMSLNADDARALAKETEGWIAAIRLTDGRPGSLPQMHPMRSTRVLFDFFLREVLERQAEPVQRFLLMTSVFDAFDVALCQEVLTPLLEGDSLDWAHLFATVQSANLFSVPLDIEGSWMRYHHLFQHFLRSKLQYDEPTLAWHIQQNLAYTYEKQQMWEEALQVYLELDDHDNLARLLVQAGTAFIRNGRILTLENWLEKLPNEMIYSRPILISLLGVVHSTKGELSQAVVLYNMAEEKLRGSENKTDLAVVLDRRAEAHRQLGKFNQALSDIEQTLELTKDTQDPLLLTTLAEAQRVKGLSLYGLGQLKEALSWLQDALQTCQEIGMKTNIPILETEIGVVHRRLGEQDLAVQYYTRALAAWENAGNTGWKARLLNNLALLHHMTGRLDQAFPLLEQALQVAERSGYLRTQTNTLISFGDLLTDLEDFDAARDCYEKALTLATNLGDSLLIFYATLGESRLKHLNGDVKQALEAYKQAEVTQIRMGLYEQGLLNIEKGACLLQDARVPEAVQVLREAVDLFDQGKNQMEQASARLWLAVAMFEQDPQAANLELKALIPPSNEWQRPTPLMISAARAGNWLQKKKLLPLEDQLANEFFAQAGRLHDELTVLRDRLRGTSERINTTYTRLDIYTFGPVRVYFNDRELKISDWQTREARDIFFFLLQSPPLTKEQIALEFWPDISPARLKMRFKINMHRIRRALGQNSVIFEGKHYQLNRSIIHSLDREKFDWLLEKAANSAEKADYLEQAVELVSGPYLADIDGEWALPERLRYQERAQQVMLELAEIYLQRYQFQQSLDVARKILNSEPLLESAHRLVMRVFAAQHDPANLARQYQEYQRTLADELGLQPSSEMISLYNKLISQV